MTLQLVYLALLITFTYGQDQNSGSCYACASKSLQGRWQITGLPRPSEKFFLNGCENPQGGSSIPKDPCQGQCITIMFTDPEPGCAIGNPPVSYRGLYYNKFHPIGLVNEDNIIPLFIRGCHTTLVQTVAERSSQSNGANFCEYDQDHRMTSSNGNVATVQYLAEFCSGQSIACNHRTSFTNPTCTQQTVNRLLNNSPLSCYQCTPSQDKNCKDSQCSKKYCLKQHVKFGDKYQLTKTCSDVNIYGRDNACMGYDITTTPGGVAVTNRYTQCYCKDEQYCNSSSLIKGSLLLLATVSRMFL